MSLKQADLRVWVTGAGGLIGNELVRSASQWVPHWRVLGLTRRPLDITDPHAVRELFRSDPPGLIIHCAALSKSPACEANRELAWRTNVEATRCLAGTAEQVPFIFFSTDLIFDGSKGDYVETDTPNPLMFYGETKLAAEQVVRAHPLHTIVRISLTGGQSPTGDRGFNEEMRNAWLQGKTLNLFTDEYRCPMYAPVTARAVWELAVRGAVGTFHLCAPEKLSRYEIGRLVAAQYPDVDAKIRPGTRAEYSGPPRPADTSLNIAKIQSLLSFQLPRFSGTALK